MLLSNAISRLFGKFAQTQFPTFVQQIINTSYVKLLKLDMSEFQEPQSYKTLNHLFTRALKEPRVLSYGVLSPVDAFISKVGVVQEDTLFQIKGREYSLKQMLTNNYEEQASKLEGADYINFYLSPRDYHRYHIPCDMRIKSVTHVPGKLYPVNFKYLRKVPNLFIENERVIVEGEVDGKLIFMVLVGALNVGKIVINFEKDIETNRKIDDTRKYTYSDLTLKKGEEFGYFKMGSTLVMISQKDLLKLDIYESSRVRFGDRIADFK